MERRVMNAIKIHGTGLALTCVLTTLVLLGGCKKNEESIKVQSLQGKVERIEIYPDGTGKITVLYFSEKDNQEITGTGLVTKETEILINGSVAALTDIREGERVRGEVRIAKKGDKRIQVALKIYIDRAKPVGGSG